MIYTVMLTLNVYRYCNASLTWQHCLVGCQDVNKNGTRWHVFVLFHPCILLLQGSSLATVEK